MFPLESSYLERFTAMDSEFAFHSGRDEEQSSQSLPSLADYDYVSLWVF